MGAKKKEKEKKKGKRYILISSIQVFDSSDVLIFLINLRGSRRVSAACIDGWWDGMDGMGWDGWDGWSVFFSSKKTSFSQISRRLLNIFTWFVLVPLEEVLRHFLWKTRKKSNFIFFLNIRTTFFSAIFSFFWPKKHIFSKTNQYFFHVSLPLIRDFRIFS